jgi:hypothetical protein
MTKYEQTIANLKKLKPVHNGSYGADIDVAIKAILEEMDRLSKANPASTYEEMTAYELSTIAVMLMDISKSLAVLTDKAESEDEG